MNDLSDDERHALVQTIAAERLEGWQPAQGDVEALVELLTGVMSFGEYLGRYRPVSTPRRRRPLLARRKPYFIPGTSVLRNNFGIDDAAALARLEFVATAGRILQVHMRTADNDLDVRQLHQHVFGDVYAWAGEPRIVELRRGDSKFGFCEHIPQALAALSCDIASIAHDAASLDDGELTYQLARIYAEYNQIHPFREGNGRTGTLLLHVLARRTGHRLCLENVPREDWVAASRDSMPFRRNGRADPKPFVAVLRSCLRPDRDSGR